MPRQEVRKNPGGNNGGVGYGHCSIRSGKRLEGREQIGCHSVFIITTLLTTTEKHLKTSSSKQ